MKVSSFYERRFDSFTVAVTNNSLCFQIYAESLSWESDQIGVDPEHPDTPEWKRKEAIYNQVLQYFDRGKCWEKGLPILRELATLYETKLCDYARLAHCLRTHATFLDSVLTPDLRPEPEYFRVGFYGKGCPLFVRVSVRCKACKCAF